MALERPADAVLPESAPEMIAARLDTRPAAEKGLLQEAAVIGAVFWLGTLAGDRSQRNVRTSTSSPRPPD